MFLTWLLSAALALPPDGLAALLPVGSGALQSMGTSWDGDVVYGIDKGSNQAFVLHVEDWSVQVIDTCTARSATWIGYTDHFGELWVGCESGSVLGFEWNPETGLLSQFVDDDGTPFTLNFGASVAGLWYSNETGLLYGLETSDTLPAMHSGDPFYGTVDGDAFPLILPAHTGFNEGALLLDDTTLLIHHGGNDMTTVDVQTGTSLPSTQFGGTFSPTDIHPSWNGGVYGVSSNLGNLGEYLSPQWVVQLTGLNEPNAVIANLDLLDPWIAVTGGDVRVWELNPDTGAIIGTSDTPYFQSNPGEVGAEQNWIQDGVSSGGYLWGGGTSGNLHVATARPWVDPGLVTATPGSGTDGDEVVISFSLDEALDWEVRLGGDRDGSGTRLASGATGGAETVQTTVTVGADWAEGDNFIYVIAEDSRNLTGHARTEIVVDNPPGAPVLKSPDLDFADRALILSFDGIEDADIAEYEVYVTVTEFNPADFETGGPAFDGTGKLTTPIVVSGSPGARVTVDIKPLKNDITHYVAVRAVDQGGLVGPMSNVISGTPRPSYSASDLAGEAGGCVTAPAGAVGWLAVGLAALASLRRRTGLAALVAAALVPGTALAQDNDKKGLEKDMTPQRGDFELRYGGIFLQDENITSVFNETQNNILQVEFGPSFGRIVEVDVGIGFFQELAKEIDAGGRKSGNTTMLTWWPALALDGTLRLHILDEQLIVPYIRGGFDYIVWSEKSDSGTGKDIKRGGKVGNHMGLGASLLLDPFDKGRASLLEAQTGINDTYLTFEWRKQRVDGRSLPWEPAKAEGFDFSATMFTVGLKLDY